MIKLEQYFLSGGAFRKAKYEKLRRRWKARAGPEGETSFPYGVKFFLFACPVASRGLCYGARPSVQFGARLPAEVST